MLYLDLKKNYRVSTHAPTLTHTHTDMHACRQAHIPDANASISAVYEGFAM